MYRPRQSNPNEIMIPKHGDWAKLEILGQELYINQVFIKLDKIRYEHPDHDKLRNTEFRLRGCAIRQVDTSASVIITGLNRYSFTQCSDFNIPRNNDEIIVRLNSDETRWEYSWALVMPTVQRAIPALRFVLVPKTTVRRAITKHAATPVTAIKAGPAPVITPNPLPTIFQETRMVVASTVTLSSTTDSIKDMPSAEENEGNEVMTSSDLETSETPPSTYASSDLIDLRSEAGDEPWTSTHAKAPTPSPRILDSLSRDGDDVAALASFPCLKPSIKHNHKHAT